MRIPRGVTWELVVVNNNSTDHTDRVLTCYQDRLPLRTAFEAKPGKSNALNRAVAEARGDLIIWTDDDVLVDPDWLAAYAAAADRWPSAAFFGGPIEPWFEGDPPAWLTQVFHKVEAAFAMRDLGKEPLALAGRRLPYGANLAVRTALQRQYLYDPDLGPRPDSGLRGEETAVLEKMVQDGFVGQWVPDARVKHFIPRDRQTIFFLRKFYHGHGILLARTCEIPEEPTSLGCPRSLLAKLLKYEAKYQLRRFLCAPPIWINDFIQVSTLWGQLEGLMAGRKCTFDGPVKALLRF